MPSRLDPNLLLLPALINLALMAAFWSPKTLGYFMASSIALSLVVLLPYKRTQTRRRIARANRFRFCPYCNYPIQSAATLHDSRVTCNECGSTFDRQFTRLFWLTCFYRLRQHKRKRAIPLSLIKRVRAGQSLPSGAFRAP